MAFPATALGLKAEIQLAGVWTDITQYLDHDEQDSQEHPAAVTISRGRQDELATSSTPQSAVLKVWNGDGRFCSKNPVGAYYPNLTRNTPLRISYPGTTGTVATYMQLASDATGAASAPDTASLDITGQIDVRIDLVPEATAMQYGDYMATTLPSWGSTLVAKYAETASSRAWAFTLEPTGQLAWHWYDNGVNHHELFTGSGNVIPLGQRIGLRCVFVPSTGVATFYTAPTMAGPWTVLATQAFGATTMQAGTGTQVQVGGGPWWAPLAGSINEVQIYNSSSTLVADPIFSSQTAGTTSFNDAQSNTWTLSGIAVILSTGSSSRNFRFYGQISSLPVTWDPTGNDVWATITANGVLRRLQQGNQPNLFSTMRRFLQNSPAPYAPLALWPCEDAQGTTSIASALPGGFSMQVRGSPNFASNSAFACSGSLPVINNSTWTGNVKPYTATGQTVCRFLLSIPASSATPNNAVVLRMIIGGGTCAYIDILYGNALGGQLGMTGFNSAGGTVFNTGYAFTGINGKSMMVSAETGTIFGIVQEALRTVVPGQLDFSTNQTTAITPGTITQIIVDPAGNVPDIAIGQIVIQGAVQGFEFMTYPLNAWLGEPAGVRFARLCQENGIQPRVDGVAGYTQPMGYQVPDTLMNLLQACEDTDRGQIYDPRDFLGLAYRTLDSLESQSVALTLDYNQDHMTPPLTPTDDDLYIVNDVTVNNSSNSQAFGGSSAVAQLNDGSVMSIGVIGDYSNSYSVSTQTDQMLPDVAGWILHVGANNDERYPTVVVNLASTQPQIAAIAATVEALDIGAYAQIINTPSFLPPGPVNLLVWGYTELLGDFCNEITFNTVPESPYEVAVSDDAVRGHADTDGSTLSAGVDARATTLSVATTNAASPLWTTNAGDLPFDIIIDGERITVNGPITGSSSPQSFTNCVRSVNGIVKAHLAGAVVDLYQPAFAALAQ